jgi:hypothetical protein
MYKTSRNLSRGVSVFLTGIVCCVLTIVMSFGLVCAQDNVVWQKNPNFDYLELHDIAYGNDLYVAVGADGIIKTSSDAVNWDSRESGVKETLRDIVWNGKIFLASALGNTLITSTDGINWSNVDLSELDKPYFLNNILWDGQQFIATGSYQAYGAVLTSPDGFSWTVRLSTDGNVLDSVAWNGREYMAVGYNGSVYISPDSVDWVPVETDREDYIINVATDGKIFVASTFNRGNILTSADGAEWTSIELTGSDEISDIIWDGNKFVVTSWLGQVFTSPDGKTWTKVFSAKPVMTTFGEIIYTNGKYIAVGSTDLCISEDLKNWTYSLFDMWENLNGIGFNGTTYVVSGDDGTMIKSNDAENWAPADIDTLEKLNDVVWNGEKFVSVGENGNVHLSLDGNSWFKVTVGTTMNINKIVWNGESFLAVGDSGVVLKSVDGLAWTVGSVADDTQINLMDVIWDGSRFVAVGAETATSCGVVAVSEDGINWARKIVNEASGFKSIAYSGNRYVASGAGLFESLEADVWEKISTSTLNIYSSIMWDGKRFIAVGQNNFAGVITTSVNGLNWNLEVIPGPRVELNKISLCGDKYIVLGNAGANLTGTLIASGDLNNDGLINNLDSELMKEYLLRNNYDINKYSADINSDGAIDSLDNFLLKQLILSN